MKKIKNFKIKTVLGVVIVGLTTLLPSCVQGDFSELYDEELVWSNMMPRTKGIITDPGNNYSANWGENECATWALMKVVGLNTERFNNKVTAINALVNKTNSSQLNTTTATAYENKVSGGGFTIQEFKDAASALGITMTSHSGASVLGLSNYDKTFNNNAVVSTGSHLYIVNKYDARSNTLKCVDQTGSHSISPSSISATIIKQ